MIYLSSDALWNIKKFPVKHSGDKRDISKPPCNHNNVCFDWEGGGKNENSEYFLSSFWVREKGVEKEGEV